MGDLQKTLQSRARAMQELQTASKTTNATRSGSNSPNHAAFTEMGAPEKPKIAINENDETGGHSWRQNLRKTANASIESESRQS